MLEVCLHVQYCSKVHPHLSFLLFPLIILTQMSQKFVLLYFDKADNLYHYYVHLHMHAACIYS